jgi:hypothetical protein
MGLYGLRDAGGGRGAGGVGVHRCTSDCTLKTFVVGYCSKGWRVPLLDESLSSFMEFVNE